LPILFSPQRSRKRQNIPEVNQSEEVRKKNVE